MQNTKDIEDALFLLNIVEDNDSDSNARLSSSSPNHNKPTEECAAPRTSALDEELSQDC